MVRIASVVLQGIPHHLTQRGNRRMQTFFSDDDYREYIALMDDSCRRYEVDVG
jgi:putative transposase